MWLLYVDLLLRLLPFLKVQKIMDTKPRNRPGCPPAREWETILACQASVRLAAHNHLHPMGCLRQALVLKAWLTRKCLPTNLRIGVRKKAGQFQAHAWLEFAGRSIEFTHLGDEAFSALSGLDGPG
jgi:hypothetical protein